MRARQFSRCMGVPPDCWCRIFIFGRAANGCADCASWKRTSAGSGSRWAITITVTRGRNRDMTAIETAAAPARRLEWQQAQVRQIAVETYRVKSLLLHVAGWQGH